MRDHDAGGGTRHPGLPDNFVFLSVTSCEWGGENHGPTGAVVASFTEATGGTNRSAQLPLHTVLNQLIERFTARIAVLETEIAALKGKE